MLKASLVVFLAAILLCGLLLVGVLGLGSAGAATFVSGIIGSDTEWRSTSGPYNLSGSVTVAKGVTLTIRGGAEVNLGKFDLVVDGTLYARGRTDGKIIFNSEVQTVDASDPDHIGFLDINPGRIVFREASSNWNEQTGAGSIIENAILSSTRIFCGNSPKINNNTIITPTGWVIADGGSPIISNNTIIGGIYVTGGGSPTILDNTVTNPPQQFGGIYGEDSSPLISRNTISNWSKIEVNGGKAVIVNNTIAVGTSLKSSSYDPSVFLGIIYISGEVTSVVSNNTITGASPEYDGIYIDQNKIASINGNNISGCQNGINIAEGNLTIEKNLLTNNHDGIKVRSGTNLIIQYNTIINNSIGIDLRDIDTAKISFNNIHNNTQNNIYLSPSPYRSNEIDATNNYWGTTNKDSINQTIYDNKNDSRIAKVNFEPFLNEPYSSQPPTEETRRLPIEYLAVATVVTVIIATTIAIHFIRRRKKP
ncbi:MAG TPA: right-handed parallel beta-helix repeat-containing protein [Candidatus Bathyarchaeia archaeon]|nr:right-handed parallel beta-helix repeat-containing protein [Candidatus Bathyarchaeia archaeon]